MIHYLMENILTFARGQVTEIVWWCQLHESVESKRVRFFFFFSGERYQANIMCGNPLPIPPGESSCRPGGI